MGKREPPTCPRCGGKTEIVSGFRQCVSCRHTLQQHQSFDRTHDLPRDPLRGGGRMTRSARRETDE